MANVLVTGVGAIIGYGVVRSLKKSSAKTTVFGTDIYHDAAGQKWADKFITAPLTSSPSYLEWLRSVIRKHDIDLVIPCIEQDVYFLSAHRSEFSDLDVTLALNNLDLVVLTQDKWLMDQELKRIQSPFRIPSTISGSFAELREQLNIPFIMKPRCGYASKGLVIVHDESDFLSVERKLGASHLAQPLVGSDDEEYTVAVFGDGCGNARAMIALLRKLGNDGATAKASVCNPKGLEKIVSTLCAHFKPIGPTNFQFRNTTEGWKLLEINPRISSTTSMRTAFGYNEAQMCLDFYLGHNEIGQPKLLSGSAVRYIEDYITYDCDPL